jgi:hypothetical protein
LRPDFRQLSPCRSTPPHAITDSASASGKGESVAAVREVVEGAVGLFSDNEYSQMEVDGLTPQLGK